MIEKNCRNLGAKLLSKSQGWGQGYPGLETGFPSLPTKSRVGVNPDPNPDSYLKVLAPEVET